MTEVPTKSRFAEAAKDKDVQRVCVAEGALGEDQQFASVAALFPNARFDSIGAGWPDRTPSRCDLLIVAVDAAAAVEVDTAMRRLKGQPAEMNTLVVLRNADVTVTRRLMREGAADVIPAPANEAALAVALDKILGTVSEERPRRAAGGQVVAVLKAGGGVGATSLCVQSAAIAARGGASVCLADLDLQFGAASLYLDMPDAATVSDCMAAGSNLKDIDFGELLGQHRSGVKLLAAPRQVTPLEALAPPQTEALLNSLKRSFDLVMLDLPSVWTAWTNRALHSADRIVLVTHLSVPHMHMLDRQIATLHAQGLDDRKLTLICNALSSDHTALLSIKSAERALGRSFDVVVPEDRRTMNAAINQGVELSTIRRGSKIERAIEELAQMVAPQSAERDKVKRRWA